MYETFPKSKKKVAPMVEPKSEELGSPYTHRATITDTPENRQRQVYGNQYGKSAPAERPEKKGIITSPRKTMISIG